MTESGMNWTDLEDLILAVFGARISHNLTMKVYWGQLQHRHPSAGVLVSIDKGFFSKGRTCILHSKERVQQNRFNLYCYIHTVQILSIQ